MADAKRVDAWRAEGTENWPYCAARPRQLAIHRPRVSALPLVPRPGMTCSFPGR